MNSCVCLAYKESRKVGNTVSELWRVEAMVKGMFVFQVVKVGAAISLHQKSPR